jgi:predicted CopG family antitoxin
MAKTVRIDEETYRSLCEQAGKLEAVLKRPVSLDETIRYLTGALKKTNRISDLAGTWNLTDEEIETIKKSLEEGWQHWTQKVSA